MVLSDAVISSRRTAYACCAGEFSVKMRKAHQTGNTASYERNRKMMVHALWAADVMNRTALSTETFGNQCVTHEEAAKVIEKLDPFCVRCGCSDDVVTPPVPNCDITPDYTVIGVADAFLGPFDVDGQYLITTDEFFFGAPPIGAIGTAVSGVFTQTGTLGVGEVALDSGTGEYWQGGTVAPWPLFPSFTYIPLFSDVIVQSLYGAEQLSGTRDVLIEYTVDGTNWLTLTTVSEGDLSDPSETIPLDGASLITNMRFSYVIGGCTYGPYLAQASANPLPDECPVCVVSATDFVEGGSTSLLSGAFVFAIQGSVDPITVGHGNQIISTDVFGIVTEQQNTGCQDGDYMQSIVADQLNPGLYNKATYRLNSSASPGWDIVADLQPTIGIVGPNIEWNIVAYVDNRAVTIYYSADVGVNWFAIDSVLAGGGSTAAGSFAAASVPSGDLLFVASYQVGACYFNSSPVPFNNP